MEKVKVEILTGSSEPYDSHTEFFWSIDELALQSDWFDTEEEARQHWLDTCKALRIPDDAWEFVEGSNG